MNIKVYPTHLLRIAFMVDRLAGQNTLTALSHIEATQLLVTLIASHSLKLAPHRE